MSYAIIPQHIPQDKRAEYNEKILFAIDKGDGQLSPETVYNCYTGIGGLHGLKQDDFANYHQYAEAKKEFEMGQFFTPHELCRRIVAMVAPTPGETVLDMGCGMGNFFNFLPNPYNVHGFDIDPNAVKVARYLYPNAHISLGDLRDYDPDTRFDLLLGNPPYNLRFDRDTSQFFYCKKACDVLNPAALMVLVVPQTFMQSEFWDKSEVRAVEKRFSFLGQAELPSDAFAAVGVEEFRTKVMVFSRVSGHIESNPYEADEFVTMDELAVRIADFRKLRQEQKLNLARETHALEHGEEERFEYKLKKYLYELKAHPHLHDKYSQAEALIAKFRNQKPPDNASHTARVAWEKKKLTRAQVLSVIRRYIRRQYEVPRKEVALVKTSYAFKLKGYAPRLLDDIEEKSASLTDLVSGQKQLPDPGDRMTPKLFGQYEQARRFIARKRREYLRQEQRIKEMEPDPAMAEYIAGLRFYNKEMESCAFTPLQQEDMNRLFQKRYWLINWQQGSGKTAVVYHFAKLLRSQKKIRNAVVLAPAIAIELTWIPFLKRHKKRFVRVCKPSDLEHVKPGMYVVVSISMLGKLERAFKRFMRMRSNKVGLIFDESDEITNDEAQRTRMTLNLFRRVRYKALATGTTTRNNIAELYSQIELLYNNSVNMLCLCPRVYYEDRTDHTIWDDVNPDHGQPFPPRGGAQLFKACFCPGKATVFGIEKHNQDIYNKDELAALIGKTILTRKFREFAGDKYEVFNHKVMPGEGERGVYQQILEKFCEICYVYFNSTGDAKKEAGLRLMRQITLMIRACSIPNRIIGYAGEPFPRKTRHIADMIRGMSGKVAVGCTSLEALEMYADYLTMVFPDRPQFVIRGDVTFKRRQKIIAQFEATSDGLLLCTQQSLKSSANIPSCDKVILEALQWNIPKMEQFYFRFIRLDSKGTTQVHFVTYDESIEQNLIALVLTKERLNEFIKSGEVMDESEIFNEFDVSPTLIENLLKRQQDAEGNFYISWGGQKVA